MPASPILLDTLPQFSNRLLQGLPPSDLVHLKPHLRRVTLHAGQTLGEVGAPTSEVYFPDSGIISVMASKADGKRIETAPVGFEGMTGLPVILGDDLGPDRAHVQISGRGRVIEASRLRQAMAASSALRNRVMRYAHVFMVLVGQTALASGHAKTHEQVARWLLMASDRIQRHEITLTHDLLALVIGARRAGITEAIHRLEGALLIRARRGSILIRDREGLERAANGFYGVAEAEYRRLLGVQAPATSRRDPLGSGETMLHRDGML